MVHAQVTERGRDLERAGAAPDDDDRVVARRERRAQLRHRFAARSRRACAWSIRYITRGWSIRNASTRGPASTRQRSGRIATTSAIGRLAEDDRDLAEELPAPEPRALRAVDHDRRLAVEDHVEPGPGEALAQDLLALGEDRLLEGVDDALQLGIGQVGEQREARDRVDQFLAFGHGRMVPDVSGRRKVRTVDGPPSSSAAWPPSQRR